ncbi:MAG TPA: 16S rRNA (cytosine(1402)-N(4))-methyltransferase RsmH [Dehalococcoidia bacterium]|nr:16S rRNA (cytosine(1402)-N(4))-methyltransferase RsmH [Dehalococcoidia bacterium]
MVNEVVQGLAVSPGGRYIDCTLGGGGHAAAILEHNSPGGQLLGLDADPEAVSIARDNLQGYLESVLAVNENFTNLRSVCDEYDFYPVHGILFDLGLSSFQLASDTRGFSFQRESMLDMRFSPEQEVTAGDIVNSYPEGELARLLWICGEEPRSNRIAHYIVEERPVRTTLQLARIVEMAVGGRKGRTHPATRTFQALRIAVNHELQNLEETLRQTIGLLGFEGRLVVISYHSLEDRIVKQFMRRESQDCICPPGVPQCVCGHSASLRIINKKVIKPSQEEVRLNPRSRSAKLRVAERLTAREEIQPDRPGE